MIKLSFKKWGYFPGLSGWTLNANTLPYEKEAEEDLTTEREKVR